MRETDLFKRYVLAKTWSSEKTYDNILNLEKKLSSLEMPEFLPFSFNTISHFESSFSLLPIENEAFVNRLLEMTVEEVKSNLEVVPEEASTETILGILNKNIADHHYEITMFQRSFYTIKEKLLKKFDHSSLSAFQRGYFSENLTDLILANSGFRNLMDSIFFSPSSEFTKLLEIHFLSRSLLGNNATWIEENFVYGDYAILKIQEKLGVTKTIQAIQKFSGNDEPLIFDQWMVLADHYDELEHVPFSWLQQMV